jgi:hypothetical protein
MSLFSVLEDCPSQYRSSWAWAWGAVLEKETAAETELDKERPLKWICFLPQALFRMPRRLGKSGRGAVNKRFAALARGYWEELVKMWESDVRALEERKQRRVGSRPSGNDSQVDKK